jgi:hypothetical protein
VINRLIIAKSEVANTIAQKPEQINSTLAPVLTPIPAFTPSPSVMPFPSESSLLFWICKTCDVAVGFLIGYVVFKYFIVNCIDKYILDL